MWPLAVPPPPLVLLLCSGLAGQVGARGQVRARGTAEGGDQGGSAETPRGPQDRQRLRAEGVAAGEGLGVHHGFGQETGGFRSSLKPGRFGGQSDLSFGVLNPSVIRSPRPHHLAGAQWAWGPGDLRGPWAVAYLSLALLWRVPASAAAAPYSSPAPPEWEGGGTHV